MNSSNKGLTVGELTMAIGALILAALIWSSFNRKEAPKENAINQLNQELLIPSGVKS